MEHQVSRRTLSTDNPVVSVTQDAMAQGTDVIGLAQGVVYWPPPPEVLDAAQAAVKDPSISRYGPDMGMPELRQALREKVARDNKLYNHNICVTHGCQQAFINVMLTLTDPTDKVILFRPCYFDHHMSICQLGGGREAGIVFGPRDSQTMHPDIDWLRTTMSQPDPPKVVALVNPCNPTGIVLSEEELRAISDICAGAKAWLILDETYENFVFSPELEHETISAPHVVHLFSFSKAYGMMGWRCGYIAYPDFDWSDRLGKEFIKCQDTVCICANQLGQRAALKALEMSCAQYRDEKIATLKKNRELLLDALSPLGTLCNGIYGGEALYFFAKLPHGCEDDLEAMKWLVKHAGVCIVPGSACHQKGYFRVSFGNLDPASMEKAAARLKAGLARMVVEGIGAN
ncbi:putative aspartate aminotransferase [Dunaliella salina]|uniref:Aspartate aminotransferase n=1 Tax=Dunaliella salina TaxID=3046 RepID=A0ABQ7GDL1_DUNSA|nr:putative aspartate aminotransferase [Dunaliella salina]|eukprot:KAF5832654.1 putative aspartate aminotransferase [Dunaliella salina]